MNNRYIFWKTVLNSAFIFPLLVAFSAFSYFPAEQHEVSAHQLLKQSFNL